MYRRYRRLPFDVWACLALTLPSGERVAAWINGESVQETGGYDYYSSDKI